MKTATKAEKERMATISRMPCIVCMIHLQVETPAMVHHMIECGRRMGHKFTLPLCWPHHQSEFNDAICVSRHPYKAEFERRYGSEAFLLEETNKIINNY